MARVSEHSLLPDRFIVSVLFQDKYGVPIEPEVFVRHMLPATEKRPKCSARHRFSMTISSSLEMIPKLNGRAWFHLVLVLTLRSQGGGSRRAVSQIPRPVVPGGSQWFPVAVSSWAKALAWAHVLGSEFLVTCHA